jgi:hypothetical protein
MQFASENAIHLSQRGAFRCSGLGRKEIDVNWLKISGGIGARWTNVLEYLLELLLSSAHFRVAACSATSCGGISQSIWLFLAHHLDASEGQWEKK